MTKKKIVIVKQQQQSNKKTYTDGRLCLNCGMNIDHRSPKVQFCCPACKASYKDREKLGAEPIKPVSNPMRKFYEKYGKSYQQNNGG